MDEHPGEWGGFQCPADFRTERRGLPARIRHQSGDVDPDRRGTVKLIVAGSLMLSACAPVATKPAAEQLAAGERAYQKCYSCHALDPGRNDLTGPTLHRI